MSNNKAKSEGPKLTYLRYRWDRLSSDEKSDLMKMLDVTRATMYRHLSNPLNLRLGQFASLVTFFRVRANVEMDWKDLGKDPDLVSHSPTIETTEHDG